jgi:Carboxypeptidase regulatory-like domain
MNCRRFLVLVVMLFLGVSGMLAQTTTTGSINGNITDPTGAAVVGAGIVLTNDGTGAKMTAKSASNGTYHFDLIQPGAYTILVDMPGFSKLESKVEVANSQVLAADLKLAVGSESTTVDVTATGTILQAENGNVATNITQKQLEEVPNSGNNLAYATKLAPGFNTGFGVVGATQYLVDGLNFNDPYNNATNSGASNLTLGLNNVQESTITSNGYSGQFGGLIGAQASFVSKSGSNRVHGDASWYWSGRALVANSWLHKSVAPIVPRSFENANQWAASISGPILHDKLFFLADSEGLRAILPASPVTVALPSANLQAYTLSKLSSQGLTKSIPFYQNMFRIYNQAAASHSLTPGNSNASNTAVYTNAIQTGCPTSSNALSTADQAGLGLVNNGGIITGPAAACTNSYASNATTYANEALEIGRIDYIARANEKMYIRVEHDAGVQPTTIDPIDPLFNAISIQPEWNGQFNETHTWGTRVVNNFLLGSSWYGALFGPANLQAQLTEFPGQTSFNDSSLSGLGGSISSFPTGRNITNIQLQDDVALTEGVHTIKFGAKFYVTKENDHYFTAGTNPLMTVATLGAFINGGYDPALTTGSGTTLNYTNATTFAQTFPVRPNFPVQVSQVSGYIQDDWKATRELTINGTLRLEHQGNIRCLLNCLSQFVTQFPDLVHTSTIPYNQAYLFNQQNVFPGLQKLEWQPRVGFAYNPPIMNNSLVVRGGFGFFFDGLASSTLEGVAKNPPTKNSFTVSQDHISPAETSNLWTDTTAYNAAFAGGITTGGTLASIKASLPTAGEQNSFTPPNAYVPQNNFKMYYVEKWNLELQKSFGPMTSLSLNYLGNHGVHKPFTNAGLNAFSPLNTVGIQPIAGLPLAQPDLRFGTVFYYQSGGANNYNGLITTFTQRFRGGSQIVAGYTYGKILDTGANAFSTGSASTGTLDIGAPPDPYHPNRYYGPSTQDERHNLVITYVYTTQYKFHNEVAQFFGGNWTISGAAFAYSGLPYTVIDTAGASGISSYAKGAYGGSLVATYLGGGQGQCNYGKVDTCLVSTQFRSATVATATGSTTPTSVDVNQGRNSFRGPMYISTDLSVVKQIPVHWEGGVFSVSCQAFNVLNHLNFSRPTASLSSGSFGKITSTVNPSGLFSGVGGDDSPRILQLKAKIQF